MDIKRMSAAVILILAVLFTVCALCSTEAGRDSPEEEAVYRFLEENGLAPDIYGDGMWP